MSLLDLARPGITERSATSDANAHVLRRVGFDPPPDERRQSAERQTDDLIDDLLGRRAVVDAPDLGVDENGMPTEDQRLAVGMFDQMLDRTNPLHERLTWFWHTHFTTSLERADGGFVRQQYLLLRTHALGNFRDLALAMTLDPAMLEYLDGAGSRAENPNENYAREFLELFTLGRNNTYTEDDVRAAARIFSGWYVDGDTDEAVLDFDATYERPVSFLGVRRRWSVADAIDHVCGLDACHRHVARRLYVHLVGVEPSDDRLADLSSVFRSADLEIHPLVSAIVRGDDFIGARRSRARQPLEWLIGAMRALGAESLADAELEPWDLVEFGQAPYFPPNVAGWPLDDRWLSTGNVLNRLRLLGWWELPDAIIDAVDPTADAVAERCGIADASGPTRTALEQVERTHSEYDRRLELLFLTALISPEFSLL